MYGHHGLEIGLGGELPQKFCNRINRAVISYLKEIIKKREKVLHIWSALLPSILGREPSGHFCC